MSDQQRPQPAPLDFAKIEGDLSPAQRAELAGLRAQVEQEFPNGERIRGHVSALRETEARIANWFDNPETQLWMQSLGNAGL
ncbi:MAG: hypothetical protein ABSH03_18675 [Candidatus Lustribacter sp.]|jgi:hypothetical protein